MADLLEGFADFHAKAWEAQHRLSWAPALANGAALLALAGIVGNVSDPDAALSGLTWPIAVFGLGLALGSSAATLGAVTAERLSALIISITMIGRTNAEIAAARDELEKRSKQITSPEGVADARKDLAAARGRLEALQSKTQELITESNAITRQRAIESRLSRAAIAAFAFGFVFLLTTHATGWLRIQPLPPKAASTSTSSSAGATAVPVVTKQLPPRG